MINLRDQISKLLIIDQFKIFRLLIKKTENEISSAKKENYRFKYYIYKKSKISKKSRSISPINLKEKKTNKTVSSLKKNRQVQ